MYGSQQDWVHNVQAGDPMAATHQHPCYAQGGLPQAQTVTPLYSGMTQDHYGNIYDANGNHCGQGELSGMSPAGYESSARAPQAPHQMPGLLAVPQPEAQPAHQGAGAAVLHGVPGAPEMPIQAVRVEQQQQPAARVQPEKETIEEIEVKKSAAARTIAPNCQQWVVADWLPTVEKPQKKHLVAAAEGRDKFAPGVKNLAVQALADWLHIHPDVPPPAPPPAGGEAAQARAPLPEVRWTARAHDVRLLHVIVELKDKFLARDHNLQGRNEIDAGDRHDFWIEAVELFRSPTFNPALVQGVPKDDLAAVAAIESASLDPGTLLPYTHCTTPHHILLTSTYLCRRALCYCCGCVEAPAEIWRPS